MGASDTDLLARATSGDSAAIERLMVDHLPGLRGYLARNAGELVRQNESVADLAQSVCREALAHLRDGRLCFQGEAEFKQWLYRAAVLKLSTRRRYWGSAGRAEIARNLSASELRPAAEGPTPSEDVHLREELDRFRRAFEQLTPENQELIALFHVEGLSHAEIAARLSITEVNSRVRLARALAQLARLGAPAPG